MRIKQNDLCKGAACRVDPEYIWFLSLPLCRLSKADNFLYGDQISERLVVWLFLRYS